MEISSPAPTSTSRGDTAFDYVIVGSGAGGAPLAAQLAEYGHSVLVLEAGPNHHADSAEGTPRRLITDVPALHAPCSEDENISWRYFVDHYSNPAQPDPKRDKDGRGIFYPRATGIGGCTIHNAMITIAGPPSDWDELAWYLNDPSWSADVMRGYFQQLECCEYHKARGRPRTWRQRAWDTFWWLLGREGDPTVGRHGFTGWLHTSMANPRIGLSDRQLLKMLKAAVIASVEAGLEAPSRFITRVLRGEGREDLDPNHFRRQSERPEGVVLIPTAIYGENTSDPKRRGRRSSPAHRLLDIAKSHSNLTIATDCLATQVILEPLDDGENYRATGVAYRHGPRLYRASQQPSTVDGASKTIHARREVILCGGTFNTPQLLMLSGIGPSAHLAELGINCKIDSPGVGSNLQDRYEVTVVTKMKEKFSVLNGATFALPTDPSSSDKPLAEWCQSGGGLYASNGAVLGILKRSRPDLAKPDLFIFGIPLKFMGYQEGYSKVSPDEFDLFTWAILKAHTQNRGGTVRLTSADPRAMPKINFNYFGTDMNPPRADDPDLEAVLAGVKFARRIAAFAGAVTDKELHPGHDVVDDQQLKDWIKREAWGHHACGTCRMGRRADPMAVTDSRFRVLGAVDAADPRRRRKTVKGLRVVDASIFPSIPGYFIVSNIYMASEKAADVIHADHGQAAFHPGIA